MTASLAKTRGTGWERWRELPFGEFRAGHVKAVKAAVAGCRGRFDNLVVLGIGGSALGNIALQASLNTPTYNLLPSEKRPERPFSCPAAQRSKHHFRVRRHPSIGPHRSSHRPTAVN